MKRLNYCSPDVFLLMEETNLALLEGSNLEPLINDGSTDIQW